MKYIITGQISVSPLNEKFQECDKNNATHQLEIYDAGTRQIAFTRTFNQGNFSYPIGSQIRFIPKGITKNILLGQIKRDKEKE